MRCVVTQSGRISPTAPPFPQIQAASLCACHPDATAIVLSIGVRLQDDRIAVVSLMAALAARECCRANERAQGRRFHLEGPRPLP
jgi:hypothetical protein